MLHFVLDAYQRREERSFKQIPNQRHFFGLHNGHSRRAWQRLFSVATSWYLYLSFFRLNSVGN